MIILAGLRHWLAVIVCMLMMILAACSSGKGDNDAAAGDSSKAMTQAQVVPTAAYDSVECQRLLDLNYDIQQKDIESLVTQCEALVEPMTNALYSVSSKSGKEASEAFRTVRSSKPMMYATQLAGFLYLAESLENVPDDLRARARRQDELASGLQRALNEALSSGAKFDPGEDDGH